MSDELDLFGDGNNAVSSNRQIMQGKDKIIFVQDVVCSYDSINDRPYLAVNFVNSMLKDGDKYYNAPFQGLPVVNRALPTGGITHYQYVLVEQFNKLCELNNIKPVTEAKITELAKSDQDSKSHIFQFNGKHPFVFVATIVPDQLVLKDPKLAVQPYLGGWVAIDTARRLSDPDSPIKIDYDANAEYEEFKILYDQANELNKDKDKTKKKVISRHRDKNDGFDM